MKVIWSVLICFGKKYFFLIGGGKKSPSVQIKKHFYLLLKGLKEGSLAPLLLSLAQLDFFSNVNLTFNSRKWSIMRLFLDKILCIYLMNKLFNHYLNWSNVQCELNLHDLVRTKSTWPGSKIDLHDLICFLSQILFNFFYCFLSDYYEKLRTFQNGNSIKWLFWKVINFQKQYFDGYK